MYEKTLIPHAKELKCTFHVPLCIFLASIYVGSLYIWPNIHGRDHPSTIKKRFLSVFIISLLSAVIVYFFVDKSYLGYDLSYWCILGFRTAGFLPATLLPFLLTVILFIGPLSLHYHDGIYNKCFDLKLWHYCLTNVIWLRNHVIAPFFEEFTFRACMLPILVPCFGSKTSVILCPLFFGIAHLHLLNEKLAHGAKLKVAILQSLFQLAYTTVFGAYSTYLFLRTGHFVAPFLVHAFCNHMGFPDFGQLFALEQPKQSIIIALFVTGLFLWIILLKPLTDPDLYSNTVYWPVNVE